MTAADAIGMLDRQIALHGEELLFMRGEDAEQAMPGFVRGFKPEELVGLLKQGDRQIAVSPTHFGDFGVPREQDTALISELLVTVISAETVRLAGTIVRVNLVVRG